MYRRYVHVVYQQQVAALQVNKFVLETAFHSVHLQVIVLVVVQNVGVQRFVNEVNRQQLRLGRRVIFLYFRLGHSWQISGVVQRFVGIRVLELATNYIIQFQQGVV